MARIKDASVREVVAAADMVEVVSGRTPLRRAGARYTGRCPFHEERTPSFSVNPVDKLYYCFGCGKGGDVITFVRETENLDFAGAVEWLAERFRVTLEYEEASPQLEEARKRRERLHAVLDQAAGVLRAPPLGDRGRRAGARLPRGPRARRGGLPRVPARALAGAAGSRRRRARRDSRPTSCAPPGSTNARGNDYFPRRLMFPLADARGRIVGFQARKLHDDDPLRGKYVNSPEGELFHKSAILYGLHLARTAIAKQERAVVVEGNTDVIALRQAGFEPVVASMGTALTERQLKELQRLTRRLYLCFDSDAAGEEATLRGMELATSLGFDVRVVTLPKGQDPADAPAGFEERLGGAESYVLYRVRLELDRDARPAGGVRARARGARSAPRTRPSGRTRCACSRTGSTCRGRRSPGWRRRAAARTLAEDLSPKLLEKGDRLERDALAACVAHPSLVQAARRALARALRLGAAPALPRAPRRRRGGGRASWSRFAPSSTRAARREGLDERTGKELLLQPARAAAAPRARATPSSTA